MEKIPPEQNTRRQENVPDPFFQTPVFFTPLRFVQLLGFIAAFLLCLNFSQASFFQNMDHYFFHAFLKYQAPAEISPEIVYIGIDQKSLQSLQPFPWPNRYYATMTRILKEWGAKAIVFDLFFSAAQGVDQEKDDQALLKEFRETKNIYLPVFFGSERSKHYYVAQSDPFLSQHAKSVGHINDVRDADGVVRKFYPFIEFNRILVPHLGVLLAFDSLGKAIPISSKSFLSSGIRHGLFIQETEKWDEGVSYYSFSDILHSYESSAKGSPAVIMSQNFKDKICLIGLTVPNEKKMLSKEQTPEIGVLGNIIGTVLKEQYIWAPSEEIYGFSLLMLGLLAVIFFAPFRTVFSSAGVLFLGLGWIAVSFFVFLKSNLWLGVAVPVTFLLSCFALSLILTKTEEYKERAYFLNSALRDELTGLYAMRYMRIFLNHAMNYTRTFKQPFAVILFDLDDFKNVNDAYGYSIGNTVLKKVASVIQSSVRTKGRALPDIAGRYGDEEFIVLLVGDNLATATFGIAERIRMEIEKVTFKAGTKTFSVTMSAGVSLLNPGENNPNQVVERAQEALLRAKASGKNQTCISND